MQISLFLRVATALASILISAECALAQNTPTEKKQANLQKAKADWDWKDSPDVKNDVISPLLVDYYQMVENLATDVYNFVDNPIIGDVKKVFDVNSYKDINSANAAFDQKYGCFVAGAAILEIDKKDMTLVYSGKSSLFKQIAIDAAIAVLRAYPNRDLFQVRMAQAKCSKAR